MPRPNVRKLSPNKTGDLVCKFSTAGGFEYARPIHGHREARMVGTIVIK